MKKPDFVHCSDCEHDYWYAGLCDIYSDDEELGIDHMMPEMIKECDRFEIKIQQELGYEFYDKLPSLDTVEKIRKIRMQMFDDLVSKINQEKRP